MTGIIVVASILTIAATVQIGVLVVLILAIRDDAALKRKMVAQERKAAEVRAMIQADAAKAIDSIETSATVISTAISQWRADTREAIDQMTAAHHGARDEMISTVEKFSDGVGRIADAMVKSTTSMEASMDLFRELVKGGDGLRHYDPAAAERAFREASDTMRQNPDLFEQMGGM